MRHVIWSVLGLLSAGFVAWVVTDWAGYATPIQVLVTALTVLVFWTAYLFLTDD